MEIQINHSDNVKWMRIKDMPFMLMRPCSIKITYAYVKLCLNIFELDVRNINSKNLFQLAFILTLQCSLTVAIAPFWPDSAYLKFVASRYLCPWLSCVESATKGFNSFDEGLYRWNMYFSANRNLQLLEISPISHGCLFSMAVTV